MRQKGYLKILETMVHMMADRLTTDYHSQSWVINHYFQNAKEHLERNGVIGKEENMKVMISLPMNGRTDEEIKAEWNRYADKLKELHIDVVDTVFDYIVPENTRYQGVYYLSKTMDIMANVDAVFFAEGWSAARGCRIERKICEEYNIKILDSNFLKLPHDEVCIRTYADSMPMQEFNTATRQFEGISNHIPIID